MQTWLKHNWPSALLVSAVAFLVVSFIHPVVDAANNGFLPLSPSFTLDLAPVTAASGIAGWTALPNAPNGLSYSTASHTYGALGAPSGGTVTNVATGCGLSGGPITTTGTISRVPTVNAQSGASYAFQDSDCGKQENFTNAGAVALSIAQAGSGGLFVSGWFTDYICTGAGGCTLTPTTSTVNGAATLVLTQYQSVRLWSNGSNFFANPGKSATPVAQLHSVAFVIDGGGAVISTGDVKSYPTADFACTIVRIDISADQTGSITVDVWKAAGAIPTSGNKISASAPLTLASAQLAQNGSISGWTTSVSVGDVFGFSVATVATVQRVIGQIWCQ